MAIEVLIKPKPKGINSVFINDDVIIDFDSFFEKIRIETAIKIEEYTDSAFANENLGRLQVVLIKEIETLSPKIEQDWERFKLAKSPNQPKTEILNQILELTTIAELNNWVIVFSGD